MKIRQQRTIEKNICKKMILLSFCMILMVSAVQVQEQMAKRVMLLLKKLR